MIGCSAETMEPDHFCQLVEQFGYELPASVCHNVERYAKSRNLLLHKCCRHCFRLDVADWLNFTPPCRTVNEADQIQHTLMITT